MISLSPWCHATLRSAETDSLRHGTCKSCMHACSMHAWRIGGDWIWVGLEEELLICSFRGRYEPSWYESDVSRDL